MNFGEALEALRAGKRAAREGWSGHNLWIAIQWPDEHSMMRSPYIYMKPANGTLVPWVASQTDLLSLDWEILPDKGEEK